MSITLTAGWWMLPLFITAIAFGWGFHMVGKHGQRHGDYDFVSPLIGLGILMLSLIVSLVAWLGWALA